MIQSKMNHGEDVNMNEINFQLEILFEQYEESLKAQQKEFENSFKGETVFLTAEETRELKSNFRRIIMALHPDLNDDVSDHEKTLFNQATIAFKSGDIETIRMIYSIIDDDEMQDELDESYYQERIDKIKEKIEKYKEEYPYNKIDLLEDESAIEEYTNSLKDLISRYKEEIEYYETRVEEMELESE
ncbi:MAG: hypothetical protein Q4P18_08130 [Methanobrevibacter sp.]|uniref:hypothetical protein n=1 Tax=Methanobrevibacter sp. TaxID=66852 RepID=UPI0026DF8950|nr:hypothetical protein [Methanobrevibacter sp.]MDO5849489.1 hypothetical protein [Methanobrevibacter sp.]